MEHADALGRIELVPRERRVVDRSFRQTQVELAERLDAVDQPQRGTAGQRVGDPVEVADHAGLVVRGHRAHEAGVRRVRAQPCEVVATVAPDRDRMCLQVEPQQRDPVPDRLGHGLVLGRAVQRESGHPLAPVAAFGDRAQGGQHRRLDTLRRTADEQHMPRRHAQHAPGAGTYLVHQGARLEATTRRYAWASSPMHG